MAAPEPVQLAQAQAPATTAPAPAGQPAPAHPAPPAAPVAAHQEVPASEGPHAFPPFASETFASQLLWLAISFVLLYLLMSRLALPRVAGILDERRNRLTGDLEAANKARADSDAAVAAYEKALADARARANAIAAETRESNNREAEQQRHALEQDLAGKLAEAERSIAATKAQALGSVRGIAADAASAIVERLTGRAPSPEAVQAAVGGAVAH